MSDCYLCINFARDNENGAIATGGGRYDESVLLTFDSLPEGQKVGAWLDCDASFEPLVALRFYTPESIDCVIEQLTSIKGLLLKEENT